MEVKGKSINDLLNIDIKDFNALSRSDLSKIVSRLGSAANKRIKTFEKYHIEPPALHNLRQGGTHITSKGKNIEQLKAEYIRAKNFLKAKTSTLKGYKQFREDIKSKISKDGFSPSNEELDKAIEIVNALRDILPDESIGSPPKLIAMAIEEIRKGNKTFWEIVDDMKERLTEEYEGRKARDKTGVSDFFEWD